MWGLFLVVAICSASNCYECDPIYAEWQRIKTLFDDGGGDHTKERRILVDIENGHSERFYKTIASTYCIGNYECRLDMDELVGYREDLAKTKALEAACREDHGEEGQKFGFSPFWASGPKCERYRIEGLRSAVPMGVPQVHFVIKKK